METLTTVDAVRSRVQQWRLAGLRIAFVPTMGNLHAGHMSLLAAARYRGDRVVASIFVNPLQFGPSEDYSGYPRTLDEDQQLLQEARCDLLFAPSVADMYPHGGDQRTLIVVRGLSDILDGRFRPGHFDGVATVVAKLFHIVGPHKAFFGQKDAAQVAVLRSMVRDLNFPVDLVVCPTVRESDGLALSSRNRYLSAEERGRALVLSRALNVIAAAYGAGQNDVARLLESGHSVLATEPDVRIDYLEIVNADTLLPLTEAVPGALVAVAAYLGATRLIDNTLL